MTESRTSPQLAEEQLPPLPLNLLHVLRRIRRCEGEVAAQVVLEYALNEQARAALAATVPTPQAGQLAIDALEAAKNGLEWYRDRTPGLVNGCDDEMGAQMDAAIAALQGLASRHTEPGDVAAVPAEPDMRAICEALGFDPTNHHNAAKCPYCRPAQHPELTKGGA